MFRKFTIFVILVLVLVAAGCGPANPVPAPDAPKPSKEGGVGPAVTLKGDAANGEIIFQAKCAECHGPQGTGGVSNPGADEPIVPALNPIEDEFKSDDAGVYAANLDLFLEHGSTPSGTPGRVMMAFGDIDLLTDQEIADVIAYVISLNN